MESIKKHVKIVALFTVFVFFIAFAITNQTEFTTESNIAANFTVELVDAPETISNINAGTIQAEKLKEKPISVKTSTDLSAFVVFASQGRSTTRKIRPIK